MVGRPPTGTFSSALVFPGGKVGGQDGAAETLACCDGAQGLDPRDAAHRVGAIREAFEEAGILLARRGPASLLGADIEEFAEERRSIAVDALAFDRFLKVRGLRLALDALVPFAHWITPAAMRRRFDTHFFVALAPEGQAGMHSAGELVSSGWFAPAEALELGAGGRVKLMFPTRMNLLRLAESATAEAAVRAARAHKVVTVEPIVTERAGMLYSRIPAEAGYPGTEHLLDGLDA
jgi:8-oxo-dGTP pyrophosphatase MutT (NUDIX family)